MGETAFTVNKFSHAFDSSAMDCREGDPIRAFGESISFGRFISEPLAWEKWSTFSHNRYQEEAEKISKPGSVAQKKAYFEAHYKKIAAKKAAALVEEVNSVVSTNVPEAETLDEVHNNPDIDSLSGILNVHVAVNENALLVADANGCGSTNPVMDSSSVTLVADANGCSSTNPDMDSSSVTLNVHVAANKDASPVADANECGSTTNLERNGLEILDVEGSDVVIEQASKANKSSEEKDEITVVREGKMSDKEVVGRENLSSTSKKRVGDSIPKSSTLGRPSKLRANLAKQTTSIQPRNVNNATTSSKKAARLAPNLLHMSINFASRAGETRKTTPVFQQNANTRIHTTSSKFPKESSISCKGSSKMSIDSSSSRKTSNDSSSSLKIPARVSVNVLPKRLSVTSQPDDKRTKTLDRKFSSISSNHSKSSNANGSKPQCPIVTTPFNFRSEERAAKRKEFFLRLQEKTCVQEAEKHHQHEKSKIPLTRPQSPKKKKVPTATLR